MALGSQGSRSVLLLVLLALPATGCALGGPKSGGGGADAGGATDAGPTFDARPPEDPTAVYAHSATTLYELDPETLDISPVGDFTFDVEPQNITDIAIDARGNTIAISLQALFTVDKETAQATHLTDLEIDLTSLSFIPVDPDQPNSEEMLIAADFDGVVYELDPETGDAEPIGDYGTTAGGGVSIGSSGDIVSVRGVGTFATVSIEGEENDFLAYISPDDFTASIRGDTGYDEIFGIGFWKDTIYGFTDHQEFLALDPNTGEASPAGSSDVAWWGAGVTTNAPVVD